MPSRQELVAFGRTEDEIAQEIGADLVIYEVCQIDGQPDNPWRFWILTSSHRIFTRTYKT